MREGCASKDMIKLNEITISQTIFGVNEVFAYYVSFVVSKNLSDYYQITQYVYDVRSIHTVLLRRRSVRSIQ